MLTKVVHHFAPSLVGLSGNIRMVSSRVPQHNCLKLQFQSIGHIPQTSAGSAYARIPCAYMQVKKKKSLKASPF